MPRPSIRPATIVEARFICSDENCEAEGLIVGPFIEIDSLACDCGAALQIVGWPARAPGGVPRELVIWLD